MRPLFLACVILGLFAHQSLSSDGSGQTVELFDVPSDCNHPAKRSHLDYLNYCGGES